MTLAGLTGFQEFKRSSQAVGDRAGNFMDLLRMHKVAQLSPFSFLEDPLRELPQVCLSLNDVLIISSLTVCR